MGVSTLTVGQDFGVRAAALFAKPSDKEDEGHGSDTQSNHGSGIPDLDSVELGSETIRRDWTADPLERDFIMIPDGDDSGGNLDGAGDKDSSKEKVRLYPYSGQ